MKMTSDDPLSVQNRGSLKLSEQFKGLLGLRNTAAGTESQLVGQLTSTLGHMNELPHH